MSVVNYGPLGRSCPCGFVVMTDHDLRNHHETHWFKGEFGGELLDVKLDATLAKAVASSGGMLIMGSHEYSLSGNKRWIVRKPRQVQI